METMFKHSSSLSESMEYTTPNLLSNLFKYSSSISESLQYYPTIDFNTITMTTGSLSQSMDYVVPNNISNLFEHSSSVSESINYISSYTLDYSILQDDITYESSTAKSTAGTGSISILSSIT